MYHGSLRMKGVLDPVRRRIDRYRARACGSARLVQIPPAEGGLYLVDPTHPISAGVTLHHNIPL